MSLILALYRAPGRIEDRLIRWATRSPYSHAELVAGNGLSCSAWAVSSSMRDGGVRTKRITFHRDRWHFIDVGPWAPDAAFQVAASRAGDGYDHLGILATFVVPVRRHGRDRWTCSELIGDALGMSQPHLLAPGDLALRIHDLNRAWARGRQTRRIPA